HVCTVCGAADDLWHLDTSSGPIAIHRECFEFLPRPEAAEPTAAYQAASPDCVVTIVQIPAEGPRFRKAFGVLQLRPPALVPEARWRLAVGWQTLPATMGRSSSAAWMDQCRLVRAHRDS